MKHTISDQPQVNKNIIVARRRNYNNEDKCIIIYVTEPVTWINSLSHDSYSENIDDAFVFAPNCVPPHLLPGIVTPAISNSSVTDNIEWIYTEKQTTPNEING